MPATANHSKPVRLAAAALDAALARQWPRAERALQRLNAECDSEGLATALIGWCDTLIVHTTGGDTGSQTVRMAAWNVDTGVIDGEIRPTVRWAMELIQARAAKDLDAFQAKLDELNAIDDGFERGKYAVELLQSVALTISSTPRGYARMGQR
ncbi:hypothetical protein [Micromonospora sp. NBRC 101691]|uniref:hypothetical protein n=1 Tax=Micromonospora sp. NBRC 101691 TaxID=3032198 RepID=UPI00249FCB3D|nr:hypothetical protein [Micromonospora sp. NBRC 101691]GLY21669.1 hypothetical protein Misp04_14010 [Micromonospora sp. NBRC 101691]